MTDLLQQELRARFRSTTEVRLTDIPRLLDALEEDGTNTDALQRLARHFHALSGLGGTYGYPRISELGNEAESSIRKGSAPTRELVARWRALIAEVARELEASQDAPSAAVQRAASRRVLIVDDDPTQLAIMRPVLSDAGYDVETCTDATEFEECIAAFAPDLVLMDEWVGSESGAQLAQRVDGTPVIFVTGDHEPATADHLAKPIAWDQLLARIASRLG